MPKRSYYLVLGISETESREGVRRAFRELAARYHPDRAGPKSTPFFQEIVTAYRTLADPERRASYDAGLRGAELPPAAPRPHVWPETSVEPLVPRDVTRQRFQRDQTIARRGLRPDPPQLHGRARAEGRATASIGVAAADLGS